MDIKSPTKTTIEHVKDTTNIAEELRNVSPEKALKRENEDAAILPKIGVEKSAKNLKPTIEAILTQSHLISMMTLLLL